VACAAGRSTQDPPRYFTCDQREWDGSVPDCIPQCRLLSAQLPRGADMGSCALSVDGWGASCDLAPQLGWQFVDDDSLTCVNGEFVLPFPTLQGFIDFDALPVELSMGQDSGKILVRPSVKPPSSTGITVTFKCVAIAMDAKSATFGISQVITPTAGASLQFSSTASTAKVFSFRAPTFEGEVRCNVTVSGTDAAMYATPAPLHFAISPLSSFGFSYTAGNATSGDAEWPLQLVASTLSPPLWAFALEDPFLDGGVQLNISCTNGAKAVPSSLFFPSEPALPYVAFRIQAPPTAGPTAQTTCSFVVDGADREHYVAPSPRSLALAPSWLARLPSITVAGSAATIFRSAQNVFSARLSAAEEARLPKDVTRAYQWNLQVLRPNSSALLPIGSLAAVPQSLSATTRDLVVDPGELLVGYVYRLTLQVTFSVDSKSASMNMRSHFSPMDPCAAPPAAS